MARSYSAAEAIGIILIATAVLGWVLVKNHNDQSRPAETGPEAERESSLRVFETDLLRYGQAIPKRTEPGAIRYERTKQTLRAPIVSYLVTYSSDDPALMSVEDADTDKVAFAINTGKRLAWEQKFCTAELKESMRNAQVNIVTGEIVDAKGKLQFAAMCGTD